MVADAREIGVILLDNVAGNRLVIFPKACLGERVSGGEEGTERLGLKDAEREIIFYDTVNPLLTERLEVEPFYLIGNSLWDVVGRVF